MYLSCVIQQFNVWDIYLSVKLLHFSTLTKVKQLALVSFTNLTQTKYSLLEGVTAEELPPWDWLVGKSVGISLISDCVHCGQLTPRQG